MPDQGGRRSRRLRLRGYQRAAVDVVDARQERALIVAACGTGKTLMAVHAVAKLLDGRPGAVLVTFPTLGLLEQTYRASGYSRPRLILSRWVCAATATFGRVHAVLTAQGLNPDGRAAAITHIDGTTTLRDRLERNRHHAGNVDSASARPLYARSAAGRTN